MSDASLFQILFRDSAQQLLTRHCLGIRMTAADLDEVTAYALDRTTERTSSILIWGSSIRMRLKTHYCLDVSAGWCAKVLRREKENVSADLADDFMAEFSNLHGAFLRGVFKKSRVPVGISLPKVLQGPGRLIKKSGVYLHAWDLSDGSRKIAGTVELEIFNEPIISGAEPNLMMHLREGLARKDDEGTPFE